MSAHVVKTKNNTSVTLNIFKINIHVSSMLNYDETNWKSENGLRTRSYNVTFKEVKSSRTMEEQKVRTERLSLVRIFDDDEIRSFCDTCNRLQEDNESFYFDKNKKFHTTVLGFPVVDPKYFDIIADRIRQFAERWQEEMYVKFDLIRLGTKYTNGNTLIPISGVSNGTVIALGNCTSNHSFTSFGNNLSSFLISNENVKKVLGNKFRRRFPTVWCTLGYYTTDFKISDGLELLFDEYLNLNNEKFHLACYDLELGRSCYKDLRDWTPIHKFSLPRRIY